eukprot:6883619-Pyramimonas_sp.AAC.1
MGNRRNQFSSDTRTSDRAQGELTFSDDARPSFPAVPTPVHPTLNDRQHYRRTAESNKKKSILPAKQPNSDV